MPDMTAVAAGETVLMTAARTGRVDAIEVLLARGADVLMMMCWESDDVVRGSDHAGATTSIAGAAETAAEAGVKQLVMVHVGARLAQAHMHGPREVEARNMWSGKLVWGDELMKVPWPE